MEKNKLIFVIDDEPDILELVSLCLKKAGYKYKDFADGKSFMNMLEKQMPDLVILDLMLPDFDGLDICKQLRAKKRTCSIPIIMLTAKSDEADKIIGLELGGDDYVTKPFSPRELMARVKATLRRASVEKENKEIIFGDILRIDLQKYNVFVNDVRLNLTSTEFSLLNILIGQEGWVFPRSQLLDLIWGEEKPVLDRTIDVHIKNLREKLGDAGYFIKNVRGVGYKIEK